MVHESRRASEAHCTCECHRRHAERDPEMSMVKRYDLETRNGHTDFVSSDSTGIYVLASDYDALHQQLGETLLREQKLIGAREYSAQLEAALREIADISEQFIGDDEDERMYKINQIADTALAPKEPT